MAIFLSLGATLFINRPSNSNSPSVMEFNPAIILNNVDFPHPEGPKITQNSLSSISKLILRRVNFSRPSYFFPKSLISTDPARRSSWRRMTCSGPAMPNTLTSRSDRWTSPDLGPVLRRRLPGSAYLQEFFISARIFVSFNPAFS